MLKERRFTNRREKWAVWKAPLLDETIDAARERSDLILMNWARIKSAVSLKGIPGPLRKPIVGVIGGTVVLIGVAMMVLPGPAFIVIPVGLGILATEFAWARRAVRRARVMIAKARGRESAKTR